MDRTTVLSRVGGNTLYCFQSGSVEYLLIVGAYDVITFATEREDVLFIRLENGKVVDKGVAGRLEEKRIKEVNSSFVLERWQDGKVDPTVRTCA
jgi:hypothetical protein